VYHPTFLSRDELLKYLIPLGFLIAAAINIAPGIGLLSDRWLKTLYGVDISGGDLSLLLRHRAVLFLIVGVLLVVGAFNEALRGVTGLAGLVSMLSFGVLYFLIPETGEELRRVLLADVVGVIALSVAMALYYWGR